MGWLARFRRYRAYCRRRGIRYTIPHQKRERRCGPFDRAAYRLRHRVECLINRCKQFRSLATRYDKRGDSYRTLWWSRWPMAGPPEHLGSAAGFRAVVEGLVASGLVADTSHLYWDVRPSYHLPTLVTGPNTYDATLARKPLTR